MSAQRIPKWFRAVAGATAGLWIIVSIYYWLGAGGVRAHGASMSFERQHDFALLQIDDGRAFRVDKYGVSITKYRRGTFPFCPLCGVNESAGTVMNGAQYRKGDWVYTDYPQPFNEAVNLKTGEVIDIPAAEDQLEKPPSEFAARGLDFESESKLDAGRFLAEFTPLSTINESCIVFNMAFLLIFAVLLVVGIVLAIRRPKEA
ncbi:hypothetical protein [Polyangium jinanense]|uniref:Uncharacterized protein n=1 Tax=Polyangium jinanense TaxID=2829994 RepID=A0A9X3X7I8_9BACT|nr:hypothetical protein [Polyangium jinanense]MDC3958775.1 hypothetical protein [Polyangium jinanense]MDC3985244.1 hypothetical protein [Polyangium jinanense]